ncbi:Pentatricopeptide repeat-containing protein family [Thalictrum thalictroides]|uniref:Pentatricopeptide repeat-containing protein family n=1 Tax=Thalictrum thalictroides TaxID=46969 RepID=A0A7J6VWN9_THATH|nr:Pentatricopeptide repeat-containing protein family [Thalictrum thalictroides]
MPELRQIHSQMIKSGLVSHTFAVSRLVVALCSLSRESSGLDYALSVFHQIQEPNAFIFFTLIRGFADSSIPLESISLYSQMLCNLDNVNGIEFSLPSVLKACGISSAFNEGKQIHGQIFKTHFQYDPFVLNSVIRMYIELEESELARQVFDKMPNRDVISWNSMIYGYFKVGEIDSACLLFDKMPEKDLVTWNTMIDGYGKCGKWELAREFFDEMSYRDVVSWTSMISGYVVNYRPKEALDLFRKMLGSGIKPDATAIVSALSAIADLGFVEEGKWVHAYINRYKISLNSGFIGSALIDMYSKCGYIEDAYHVFSGISNRRNIGDWNSMMSGFALHGLGHRAIEIFADMERMNIEPNEITFIGVLTACSHGGLVQEGAFYFDLMQESYNITPKIQHYGCMIDLQGRTGLLIEALKLIESMPTEPDILAWKSILSASVKHGDMKAGEYSAFRAIELAPKDSSCYVLLSNIYAKAGRWDDVAKVRSMMEERRVRKIAGCSSILVNGKIHEFLAGKDVNLGGRSIIQQKLEEMTCKLKLEGYKPDLTQVILDVDEEGKETLLRLHSEKMALAFSLININKGAPIHIVKNLRICCDCHSFIKLVSKVYSHPIILRDQNRFHHFKNGSCSCNEHW